MSFQVDSNTPPLAPRCHWERLHDPNPYPILHVPDERYDADSANRFRRAYRPPPPSIWVRRSASSPSSIPGVRIFCTTHTCIVSCPAVGCRRMVPDGSPAGRASSCRCELDWLSRTPCWWRSEGNALSCSGYCARGATEWFGDQHRIPADAPRRRGGENAASPVWKALNDAMPLDRPSRLNGG